MDPPMDRSICSCTDRLWPKNAILLPILSSTGPKMHCRRQFWARVPPKCCTVANCWLGWPKRCSTVVIFGSGAPPKCYTVANGAQGGVGPGRPGRPQIFPDVTIELLCSNDLSVCTEPPLHRSTCNGGDCVGDSAEALETAPASSLQASQPCSKPASQPVGSKPASQPASQSASQPTVRRSMNRIHRQRSCNPPNRIAD